VLLECGHVVKDGAVGADEPAFGSLAGREVPDHGERLGTLGSAVLSHGVRLSAHAEEHEPVRSLVPAADEAVARPSVGVTPGAVLRPAAGLAPQDEAVRFRVGVLEVDANQGCRDATQGGQRCFTAGILVPIGNRREAALEAGPAALRERLAIDLRRQSHVPRGGRRLE